RGRERKAPERAPRGRKAETAPIAPPAPATPPVAEPVAAAPEPVAPVTAKPERTNNRRDKRPEKSRGAPQPDTPFGDHVPAFILRPTEIKA
ncbi:MAG: RNA helicase, partial [Asticcacaulis sp.]|nr:RNA helicase [Asticcacaulis sp.]